MGQENTKKGKELKIQSVSNIKNISNNEDFVLEKSIFNNIFEKDIRKIFLYKKAERLARVLHLISPAFSDSESLRRKIDSIAVNLVDSALLPSGLAKTALSRELLSLSSMLSIARTGALLSSMNTEIILKEAQTLLKEVANYEEPVLSFEESPSLSNISKNVKKRDLLSEREAPKDRIVTYKKHKNEISSNEENSKDTKRSQVHIKDRQESIMSVIRNKGSVSIKDISMLIRGVSEKTIQRELALLVASGVLVKRGERRWSTYSFAAS